MQGMTKEEFKRKYMDTHTELLAIDAMGSKNGSLIKNSPGDKNIRTRGKIPGKNLIEKKCLQKQAQDLRDFFLDATFVRGEEILDPEKLSYKDLLNATIKMMPTQIEQSGSVEFTFGDMVRKAHLSVEKQETIEDGEIVED